MADFPSKPCLMTQNEGITLYGSILSFFKTSTCENWGILQILLTKRMFGDANFKSFILFGVRILILSFGFLKLFIRRLLFDHISQWCVLFFIVLNYINWLVVWNMNFMTFHSVGNFIIPTDVHSIIFQRVRLKPPTS